MFYIIGLGLGDAKDVSVKGLEIIKMCDRVYLEAYTSILTCGQQALVGYVAIHMLVNMFFMNGSNPQEAFYERPIILADRDLVEQGADDILAGAIDGNVALLVVGDPFGATTHTDFLIRAREQKIPFQVVHNASIMNAIGCCGLQLYRFGETISIPYWTDSWQPDSFYDKIKTNVECGFHTLALLGECGEPSTGMVIFA